MKSTRWLSVTTSRNDGDIAEAFIRSNAALIDKFVILDDSTDSTPEILNALKGEGFDIELIKRRGIVADQAEKINLMVDTYADPSKFSAVIPLDMDEVLIPIEKGFSKDHAAAVESPSFLPWYPFVPTTTEFQAQGNYLKEAYRGASNTKGRTKKVFLPSASLSSQGKVFIGAHDYVISGQSQVHSDNHLLAIAHFPVRSSRQLTLKLITGLAALKLKKQRFKTEGHHLFEIRDLLVDSSFQFTLQDLQKVAAFYGFLNKQNATKEVNLNEDHLLLPDIDIKYPRHSNVNLEQNLYYLVEELVDQLESHPGSAPRLRPLDRFRLWR
jgi:hypothetical protein